MKLLKRVLAVLCAIMMVVDLCLASCLTVYAREYYRAEDMIAEDSQPEMAALNVEETVPASEEIATQPAETPAADTEQTEVTTVAETTAVAGETESQAQTTVETQSGKMIESTESSSETEVKESKGTEESKEIESEEPEKEFIRTMEYEDGDVKVSVAAVTPNAIPENATLKVVPIVERTPAAGMSAEEIAEINNINNQYKAVEQKLDEKAENEEYDITGFLAYDITFVDKDGNKVEPNGEVKVSMDYKRAVIPAEAAKVDAEATDVTVMHFEEDANGQVKDVVDMVADESKEATVHTTENAEVEKTEFVTDSFSVYTVAWLDNSSEISPMSISGENTVAVGETISLTSNNDSSWQSHQWKSSNEDIAVVDGSYGSATVTGVSEGTVTITHTYGKRSETFTVTVTASGANPVKNEIKFVNIQNVDDNVSIGGDGTVDGHGYNVMKFSIVLINTDGTVSYKLPTGAVVPETTTVHATEVTMTDLIAQMGLSIPGYTLQNGWAFFWWQGNYQGTMYKVPIIRNFGGISNNYPNYYSYLGFQGLEGNVSASGSAGYEEYKNAKFAETSNGKDYGRYSNPDGYYAYNPTGTLRIVFLQVNEETSYQSKFVDAFSAENETLSWTQIDEIGMNMHQENWDQSQEHYQWYGTLKEVTTKTPSADAHPGFVFKGWYKEKDDLGNGTGDKVSVPADDQNQYTSDAYYYARWEPDNQEADKTFIRVTKTFKGITSMADVPTSFKIVLHNENNEQVAELKLSDNDADIEVSNSGLTYTWKISNLDSGKYYIEEADTELEGDDYSFDFATANGQPLGDAVVQTQSADITFSDEHRETPNSSLDFDIDASNYICGSLTSNKGFFIWTEDTLSASERLEIVNHISTFSGTFGNITESNTAFYSTREKIESGSGIKYNGIIKVENGKLTFSETKQRNMIAYGTYDKGTAINAEIEVENNYKKAGQTIRILKTSNSGEFLKNAEFKLYTDSDLKIEFESGQTYQSDSNGLVFDKKLPMGTYYLKEIKAPEGYSCLEETIVIQVTESGVTISGSEKATLSSDSSTGVYSITVKNDMLYELPSTGGLGIYWYTIGGMLFMMAAALVLYKNKHREVLKR